MKLFELNDAWNTAYLSDKLERSKDKLFRKAINSARERPDHEYVGSGSNAYVGRSTSPHEMDNVERISTEQDGNAIFLAAIHDTPQIQANPFLPRVRARRTVDGFAFIVVERLQPFTSERIMHEEWFSSWWEQHMLIPLGDHYYPDLESIFYEAIEHEDVARKTIRDPQLHQALKFIRAVSERFTLTVDIHDANMMWRVTGTMPQLVFTDPLI